MATDTSLFGLIANVIMMSWNYVCDNMVALYHESIWSLLFVILIDGALMAFFVWITVFMIKFIRAAILYKDDTPSDPE